MNHIRKSGGLAVMAAMTLAACSENSGNPLGGGPAEEQQVNLDVAAYSAEATVDDIELMSSESEPVFSGPPASSPPIGDLNVTRQVSFFDEAGEQMDTYHDQLTEAVSIFFSMEGSRRRASDRGAVVITVNRVRDIMVTGLAGDETERTWNGGGSASNNRSVVTDAVDRVYDFTSATQIDNVVMPVPRGSGWPVSGSITRDVVIQVVSGLEDTRTRTRTVVVTFNGTNLVPIVINGEEFILNLETREIQDSAQ